MIKELVISWLECQGICMQCLVLTISVFHRVLSEVVVNFPNSLEEVTFEAKKEHVTLKNYTDYFDSILHYKWRLHNLFLDIRNLSTEVRMMPDEFDSFTVTKENSVTFCLRELRVHKY